jgi:hypothetical protein
MTLGCGGWGGNITSDNITPRHLLNIKRLAYEVRPASTNARPGPSEVAAAKPTSAPAAAPALPRVAAEPAPAGVGQDAMVRQIEAALGKTGAAVGGSEGRQSQAVVDFVCEEDVRQAIRLGRTIVIGDRTIITPAARDLAATGRVFVSAGWPK